MTDLGANAKFHLIWEVVNSHCEDSDGRFEYRQAGWLNMWLAPLRTFLFFAWKIFVNVFECNACGREQNAGRGHAGRQWCASQFYPGTPHHSPSSFLSREAPTWLVIIYRLCN